MYKIDLNAFTVKNGEKVFGASVPMSLFSILNENGEVVGYTYGGKWVATNYTHMIHSPARRERDAKKRDMEERAKEQFNELVMEVELGGVKKDDVLAMIAKMNLEG